jgi:hypothetical protein
LLAHRTAEVPKALTAIGNARAAQAVIARAARWNAVVRSYRATGDCERSDTDGHEEEQHPEALFHVSLP